MTAANNGQKVVRAILVTRCGCTREFCAPSPPPVTITVPLYHGWPAEPFHWEGLPAPPADLAHDTARFFRLQVLDYKADGAQALYHEMHSKQP